MTKKLNTLLLALIFSGLSLAQDDNDRLNLVYQQWEDSLHRTLLNHPHPYVQTIGLSLSSPELPLRHAVDKNFKSNDVQQNYVDHINQLAKLDTLNPETIFLLLSMCSHDAIRDACHHQSLVNKYQQLYPDDLNTYFEPFYQAMNSNDAAMAEYLIKNMRDAKYITDMTVLHEVVKSVIKDYMDNNPLSRSVLRIQLDGLVDMDDSVSNKDINQAFYYIKLSGIKMAMPIPGYKPLLDYCSSDASPTLACVQVADILIKQSKNIISQLIGHRLKVNSYENSDETDLLLKAESEGDKFRNHYECIRGALTKNNHQVDYLDVTYAKIWFNNNNELQRIKSAAQYLYKKGLTAGYTDVKNPDECE